MLKDRKRVGWTVRILIATWDILRREIDAPSLLHNDQVDLMHWLNRQKPHESRGSVCQNPAEL